MLGSALNGIYRQLGVRRDTTMMSLYESRARARFMGEDRPENESRVDLALTTPEGPGAGGTGRPS